MAAVLRNAIRQALTQQLKGHAVSRSSVGMPGHLPQVSYHYRSNRYEQTRLVARQGIALSAILPPAG